MRIDRLAATAILCIGLTGSTGFAQGVPVIDGTNLAKNIEQLQADRKSTRLNSSHSTLSRMPSSA